MEFGLSDRTINEIREVLSRFPGIQQAIIFGSRTLNTYRTGSDIDLAIKGANISFDDMLSISDKFDELELLYKIDLQNYNTIKDEAVLDHINRVGKLFYTSN